MAQREGVGVEALFSAETGPHIRRIQLREQWLPVSQGRHWRDADGWHVLIMLPDESVRELMLNRETLSWELTPPARGVV